MKLLLLMVNMCISACVLLAFLILITVADPIVKLVSLLGHKRLAKELTRKTACLVQLLMRAWGTRFNYHMNPNSNCEKWDTEKPIIFVSSHHSCLDIVLLTNVLGGLLKGRKFSFISRSGLDKYIPLISFYLRQFCFSLPHFKTGDRVQNQHTSHSMLAEFASEQAAINGAVVIFPEGVKSVATPEHNAPFRRNGLRILLEQMPNAILVPVVIKGTRDFYTTGRSVSQLLHQLPNFSTNIELSILSAIDAETIEQKIDLAETRISDEYNRLGCHSTNRKTVTHRAFNWIL